MRVGFIGIGTMGFPMASRLLATGVPLHVWNRTSERCAPLVAQGATEAPSVDALFDACSVVMVMLLNQHAIDSVLGRGTASFGKRVRGRTFVMLGTTSAAYSHGLATDVTKHGGRYVEAPVSGSRVPAEDGTLIGMMAGDPEVVREIQPLMRSLCRDVVTCGQVPAALRTKLAVNHYLILLVAALAEATQAAAQAGVDLKVFRDVLDAGPMASTVSRTKLQKILEEDFSPQAAIRDVADIAALVQDQAKEANVDNPLIGVAARMYADARDRGLSDLDMSAVLQDA